MSYIKIQKILKEDIETPEKGYIYFGYDDSSVGGLSSGFWIKDDNGSGATYLLEGYSNAPTILYFDPTSAYNGDTITIYGTNFIGQTYVSFSGVTSLANVLSPNKLTVVIPNLSNYDNEIDVIITSQNRSSIATKYRVYVQQNKPRITNCPASAEINSTITILGSNFIIDQTVVYFGVSTPSNTVVISSTELSVVVPVVPTEQTSLYVQTNIGQSGPADIIIIDGSIPVFTNFYPTFANIGDTIQLSGANFNAGMVQVCVGPIQTSNITVVNSNYIEATISQNTPIGDTIIRVDAMSLSGFTVCGTTTNLVPTITNIQSPAYPGYRVSLVGTNLNIPFTITFSGIKGNVIPVSSTFCYVDISTNTIPGINSVIAINQYGSSLPYAYQISSISTVSIDRFSHSHTERGLHSIGVYGSGFINSPSMSVYVGNVLSRFNYESSTGLTVQILNATSTTDTIPTGNVDIRVMSINGNYTLTGFTVDSTNTPYISKISPIFGKYGDVINIYGNNLSNGRISFGVSYPGTYGITTALTNNHLSVIVPSGLTEKSNEIMNIYVTTISGSYTYSPFENYKESLIAPSIISFTPTTGSNGTIISISGNNFARYYTDSYVSIFSGGTKYLLLDNQRYVSDNEIQGRIPNINGFTGTSYIKVKSPSGTDDEPNFIIT